MSGKVSTLLKPGEPELPEWLREVGVSLLKHHLSPLHLWGKSDKI